MKPATLRRKADKFFQISFLKDNPNCEYCDKPAQLGHHFFPKSISSALRYDKRNMVALCNAHHFAHHSKNDPRIHEYIREQRGKEWYMKLLVIKGKTTKINLQYYKNIIEELNEKM